MILTRTLGPGEAGLDHGETGLHEEDEGRGHQGPDIIEIGLHCLDGSGIAGYGRCIVGAKGQRRYRQQ